MREGRHPHDEFREGNVPARQAPLACVKAAFAALPETVSEGFFRGDSACHENELLGWLGAVLHRWKMAKHFVIQIADGRFDWQRNQPGSAAEAALDGICIIRTGEPAATLSVADAVRQYKNLGRVEEVFRTLKSADILIRPIRHRLEDRVRAHVFLCLLAYYVIWHMKQALAPILYQDETVTMERQSRDPVAKAEPTPHAKRKKALRTDAAGTPLRSFAVMLETLQTRCRNRCVTHTPKGDIRTIQHTQPDDIQKRAFELLGLRLV